MVKMYWKVDEQGNKIYYLADNKVVGNEYHAMKYIMNSLGVSSSQAHKLVGKVKQYGSG